MAETYCTSGAVVLKAGKNMSSDISGAAITTFINQAENFINGMMRIDYISGAKTFSSLNANKQKLLEEAASNIAATYAIQYDMSGYTSRYEAEIMLDVLRDRANAAIELLKGKETTAFMES